MEKQQSTFSFAGKKDKGVAGLTIVLSVVAMIFIIGFLVMVFAIMGGSLANSITTESPVTVTEEMDGWINSTGYTVSDANAPGFTSFVITSAINGTSGSLIQPANYTYTSAGVVTNATAFVWLNVSYNYTYSYDANNTGTDVITDTTTALAGVTTWFPIIITITVMVALILLTVIIIVAIRSSGILAQGN